MNICIENKGDVPRRRENHNKIGYTCICLSSKKNLASKRVWGGGGEWNAECRMDTASFVKNFMKKNYVSIRFL